MQIETRRSEEEVQTLRKLKARDREVRAHEQAHLAAAGGFARGGATFTYERGPDQQLYAVAGEVQVDTTGIADDPVATLRKAQIIRRAALAPANPSGQDRTVAARATRMATEAQAQIVADKMSGDDADGSGARNTTAPGELAESGAGCPACGGAHAPHAHEGITAYAVDQRQDRPDDTGRLSAQA